MKFIDLFSGLGGFHLALKRIGHTCVFASEINETLKNIYFKNFGLIPVGDIRQVNVNDIPDHEIPCAGFPCQPFSKAGEQKGLQCERNGDLIEYVLEVIDKKKPDFIFLENVPNLVKHNDGETYKYIKDRLNQHLMLQDYFLTQDFYQVFYSYLLNHSFELEDLCHKEYLSQFVTLEQVQVDID